jgi:hypothetical protein
MAAAGTPGPAYAIVAQDYVSSEAAPWRLNDVKIKEDGVYFFLPGMRALAAILSTNS